MQIDVRDNFKAVIANARGARDQVPFATAVALTATARDVRDAERRSMSTSFDRPVPWTLNSLFLKPATKQDQTARVWVKDDRATSGGTPAVRYLAPQIEGGRRSVKAFERMLQRIGALPAGWAAVPGEGADIDQHGNMRRGQITQILSYLRAFGEQGYSANITDKKKTRMARGTKAKRGVSYFVSHGKFRDKTRHLPAGVWRRTDFGQAGSAITPILIFVPRAQYSKRWDFYGIADREITAKFPGHFNTAYQKAVATAWARKGGATA